MPFVKKENGKGVYVCFGIGDLVLNFQNTEFEDMNGELFSYKTMNIYENLDGVQDLDNTEGNTYTLSESSVSIAFKGNEDIDRLIRNLEKMKQAR